MEWQRERKNTALTERPDGEEGKKKETSAFEREETFAYQNNVA